jgi:hypothetical protein
VVLLLIFCIITVQAPLVFAEVDNSIPAGFEKITDNNSFQLYANKTNGEIATRVKATGYIWYSNPVDRNSDTLAKGEYKNALESQLVLTYSAGTVVTTVNSYVASVKKNGLKMEKTKDGVKFFYSFPDVGYTIPVQYTLEKDNLKAELLMEELDPKQVTKREKVYGTLEGDQYYNIVKIDFLPFFGAAGLQDKGYMLIPDGAGALINFNNGKTNYENYAAPIYGTYYDNSAIGGNNRVRMPIFGIKKENNAFLAVVSENESVGFINSAISGKINSYNNVYSSFQYRTIETKAFEDFGMPQSPVLAPKGNYGVKYYFLTGSSADYSGMATSYQKYLIDEKGLKKSASADKNNMYLETYGGVQKKKSILGIPTTVFEPLTTYKDLKEISEKLKAKGVDNIVIRYKEWMNNKEVGKVPTSVTFDSKLGSKKDFENMIKYSKDNGVGFYPSVDFVTFSKMGNGFMGLINAAKAPNQAPAYQIQTTNFFTSFGKRWFFLTPSDVVKAFNKYYKSYSKYDNKAIAIDSIGNMVYSDNSKNGVKRGETPDTWTSILKQVKEGSGSNMIEWANAYAFPYVDHIVQAPEPELKVPSADEAIPFYQMALHGLVSYSSYSLNLQSDPDKSFLKAVETGSNINYSIFKNDASAVKDSYLNYMYSCDLDTWLDKIIDEYKQLNILSSKTAGKKIVGHRTVAEGIKETTYENNVKVLVNYNDKDVTVDGTAVKALGYAVK